MEDTVLVEDTVDRHHLEAVAAAEGRPSLAVVESHTLAAAAAAVGVPPPSSSEVEAVDRNHTLEELLLLLLQVRSSLGADLLPSPRGIPSVVVVARIFAVAEDWQTSFAAAAAAPS